MDFISEDMECDSLSFGWMYFALNKDVLNWSWRPDSGITFEPVWYANFLDNFQKVLCDFWYTWFPKDHTRATSTYRTRRMACYRRQAKELVLAEAAVVCRITRMPHIISRITAVSRAITKSVTLMILKFGTIFVACSHSHFQQWAPSPRFSIQLYFVRDEKKVEITIPPVGKKTKRTKSRHNGSDTCWSEIVLCRVILLGLKVYIHLIMVSRALKYAIVLLQNIEIRQSVHRHIYQ